MSTAIIGDVHGDVDRLRAAVRRLTGVVDEMIFVGDYVDRGPASREVLDELIALKRAWQDKVILLRGNHDQALISFVRDGDRAALLTHGGLATARSYLPRVAHARPLDEFRRNFPPDHLELLEATKLYVERDGLLVSHCGYNPASPARRLLEDMVTGRFPELFVRSSARPQELVVFGHYVQDDMKPYKGEGIVCLDTGCGTLPGGPLTALVLPDQQVLQF